MASPARSGGSVVGNARAGMRATSARNGSGVMLPDASSVGSSPDSVGPSSRARSRPPFMGSAEDTPDRASAAGSLFSRRTLTSCRTPPLRCWFPHLPDVKQLGVLVLGAHDARMEPRSREELEADIRRRAAAGDFPGAADAAMRGYGREVYEFLAAL